MSAQVILKMGNPRLAKPSSPLVNFEQQGLDYPNLANLLKDMEDSMHEHCGVGIAAPQIGCNMRVIMYGFETNPRYPNEGPVPFTILINPVIEACSKETDDAWEGCLSVPGLRGLVPRPNWIKYKAFDPYGNSIEGMAQGFHARIIQHECDHLDGVLFPQRIKNL